ncbi:adhesin transport system outer membrane protein [Neorhizobium sp. JUb45]|nr:adhesin transport system outer membrane protein [Neorhizobium sp. JUb45]
MYRRLWGKPTALVLLGCWTLTSCTTPTTSEDAAKGANLNPGSVQRGSLSPLQQKEEALRTSQEQSQSLPSPQTTADYSSPLSVKKGSLEEAVLRAVSWHPAITASAGRVNQSSQEIDVARAGYYPKVQGGLNSGYGNGSDGGFRPRATLQVSQMVYDFGKVSNSVEAEKAGEAVSRARMLESIDTIVRDTTYAVIEVQRYRAMMKVAKDQLAGVGEIAKLVTQRTDSGASTRSDKVQAEARVQAAQSQVMEVSSSLSRWESTLSALAGVSGRVALSSGRSPTLSKACEVLEPDWQQVPTLLQAEAGKREAAAKLALSRSEIFPTIQLQADGSYDMAGSSSYSRVDNPDFTVGLNLVGNLYEGGASAARRDAADYALKAAEAEMQAARFETGRSLNEARGQVTGLKQLLASLASRNGMMIETRDLYREQYVQLGTRTLLDLLNAEQELHAARFDAVNTEHDLRKLDADCLFNSGMARKAFRLNGTVVRGVSL